MSGFDQALQIALNRLRFGDKFEAEVRSHLLSQGVDPGDAEEVLRHLNSRNLLSDRRAIEAHLLKRSGRKAVGRERLRDELLARGAPASLMEECLNAASDDLQAAKGLIVERFGARIEPAKAARFLASRGFDEDTIRSTIEPYHSD